MPGSIEDLATLRFDIEFTIRQAKLLPPKLRQDQKVTSALAATIAEHLRLANWIMKRGAEGGTSTTARPMPDDRHIRIDEAPTDRPIQK